MTNMQEKYASRIAGLLRKAESTTPEEAESLVEKAQELMAKYAIEQAMVDSLLGKEAAEKIVERVIDYKSAYHHGLSDIGDAIATANGCRCLYSRSKNRTRLYVIGFESDVERVIMLDSSLQIQAQVAWNKVKHEHVSSYMTAMEQFKERREFQFGFANGIRVRLQRAAQAGRHEAAEEMAAADSTQSVESVSESMALVVRSRKDRINDWIDNTYGKLGTARGVSSRGRGSGSARSSGHQAGMRADTGSSGRVGQRRALGR